MLISLLLFILRLWVQNYLANHIFRVVQHFYLYSKYKYSIWYIYTQTYVSLVRLKKCLIRAYTSSSQQRTPQFLFFEFKLKETSTVQVFSLKDIYTKGILYSYFTKHYVLPHNINAINRPFNFASNFASNFAILLYSFCCLLCICALVRK